MTDMIERVARAIIAELARDSGAYIFVGDASDLTNVMIDGHADILAAARAAIAATREPTIDMEIAGTEAWTVMEAMEDRARTNYRAMVDAALKTPGAE